MSEITDTAADRSTDADPSTDANPSTATWSLADALIGILIATFATILLATFVVVVAGEDGLDFTLGTQAALEASLVGVAIGYAVNRGQTDLRGALTALGFRRPSQGWAGKVALCFLAYFAITVALGLLVGEPEQTDVADRLGFDEGVFGALAVGTLIVAVVPVCEEIFFRGFFFGGLRRRLAFPLAALGSAVLFGVVHLGDANLVAGLQLAVFGLFLAWLYEDTGSLLAPIALHVINNSIAFALLVSS